MSAIECKHWAVVEYLLKNTDATIDGVLSTDDEWLLKMKTITDRYLVAAETNDWKTMSECLEGDDRDIIKKGIDHEKRTAAQIAAGKGHLDIVRNIVERNLMAPSYYDDLHNIATCAATSGHLHVVKYVFDRKDFQYQTFEFTGFNRIDFGARNGIVIFGAVTNGHVHVVEYLSRYTPREILEFVAMDCTQTSVLDYLHENGHINVYTDIGLYDRKTYLSRAAQKGHIEVVEWLVNVMNVDARVPDGTGVTPLIAAFGDDGLHGYGYEISNLKPLDTAFWLMENSGVDIDAVVDQNTGRTAIMVVCQKYWFTVMKNILTQTKVNLNAVDYAGQSVWDMVEWRLHNFLRRDVEEVLKIMFVQCKLIPDSFKDRYPDDPTFQAFVEKGQLLKDRVKSYEKKRKKALHETLSTRTRGRPEGVPRDAIKNILSFGKLTFDEKRYIYKRKAE
jgi:hypothetical protein